jgi:hypothetical protein
VFSRAGVGRGVEGEEGGGIVGLALGVVRGGIVVVSGGTGCVGSLGGFGGYIVQGVGRGRGGHSIGTRLMVTIRLYVMLIVSSGLRLRQSGVLIWGKCLTPSSR